MDTATEIRDYCQNAEAVGALMLTGEWGCGKTYFIENTLRDTLSDSTILIRVSLFGITESGELRKAVKQAWFQSWIENKAFAKEDVTEENTQKKEGRLSKTFRFFKDSKNIINSFSDYLPDQIKILSNIDLTEFIPLKNSINEKTVVLVFDDLERCQMKDAETLGVINDYCENNKFHTIIVANQEKMQSKESDKTSYKEIKEKIIQRTIEYIPDYKEIVHTVVNQVKCFDERHEPDEEYKQFIVDCEPDLLEVFAPDRNDFTQIDKADKCIWKRPHNIRSLKCALNDFYRVYKVLSLNHFENIQNWLVSYVSYVLAYKSNIVKEDNKSNVLPDTELQKIFPTFQSKYILGGVKNWIIHGVWNETQIEAEIDFLKKQRRASEPWEIIKANRILDMDDEVLIAGFSEFLTHAYNGELTLDEYVLLISNSCWAREYNYQLPKEIEWKKIESGVHNQIEKIKKVCPEGQLLFSIISEEERDNFTEDEWRVYQIISRFSCGDEFMFYKNRKIYIEEIHKAVTNGFFNVQNKRFDCFNTEMAHATAEAFMKAKNAQKNQLIYQFTNMWDLNLHSADINLEQTREGFLSLKQLLHNNLQQGPQKNTFSAIHTERFISEIEKLMKKIDEMGKKTQSN